MPVASCDDDFEVVDDRVEIRAGILGVERWYDGSSWLVSNAVDLAHDRSLGDVLPAMRHGREEGCRRKSQVDASHLDFRVLFQNHQDEILGTVENQLLTRQLSLTNTLEVVVDVDLIEQEPAPVQVSGTHTDHVVLDVENLGKTTMVVAKRLDLKLTLTIHSQRFAMFGRHVRLSPLN